MGTLNDIILVDGTNYPLAEYLNKLFAAALRGEYVNTETITAAKQLTDADYQVQRITASGGNQNVKLAAEAITNHIQVVENNGASNNVLVKDDSNTTTFATLEPGEWCMAIPLGGTKWVVIDSNSLVAVVAASLTVAGIVELATSAEIDTGTDSTRAIPVNQFVASKRNVRYIYLRVISAISDWPADGSTAVGGDFEIPFAGTITEIGAFVDTAGTTGTSIVDVNLNGSTIMTTNKLKWDSTEKSTRTYSGTAAGLTTTTVAAGDILTVDIDTNHTTKSKGLTIRLGIRQS